MCRWGGAEDVSPAEMVRDMARAGYRASDLGDLGFLPRDPGQARQALGGNQVRQGAFLSPVPSSQQVMGAFVELSLSEAELPGEQVAALESVCSVMAGWAGQQPSPHIVLADTGDR